MRVKKAVVIGVGLEDGLTSLTQQLIGAGRMDPTALASRTRLGRLGDRAEVAETALYLASDHPTAYCEKFGLQHDEKTDGLTPEELFACRGRSWTNVALRGEVQRILDLTGNAVPTALCRIFSRFAKIV